MKKSRNQLPISAPFIKNGMAKLRTLRKKYDTALVFLYTTKNEHLIPVHISNYSIKNLDR